MKKFLETLASRIDERRARNSRSPEENWTVAGAGNTRGRDWTEHAQAHVADRAADLAWLEGFFSGLSLGENYTFLRTSNDLAQAIDWMDRRLANDPEEKVSQAAAQLAARLLDPRRANPW